MNTPTQYDKNVAHITPGEKPWTEGTRGSMVSSAVDFVKSCGVVDTDAIKMAKVFMGQSPAMVLRAIEPGLHVVHVNPIASDLGIFLDPVQGYLTYRSGTGQATIKIRPIEDGICQDLFLVTKKSVGDVARGNFWSYGLVILNTEGEQPLVIALDDGLDANGTAGLEWSSRLYQPRRPRQQNQASAPAYDPYAGIPAHLRPSSTPSTQVDTAPRNRLATISGLAELENVLAQVAVVAGLPLAETQRRRLTPGQWRAFNQARGQMLPSPAPVGTAATAPGGSFSAEEPFAE